MVNGDRYQKRLRLTAGAVAGLVVGFALVVVARRVLVQRRERQGALVTQDDLHDLTAVIHSRFALADQQRAEDYRNLRREVESQRDQLDGRDDR